MENKLPQNNNGSKKKSFGRILIMDDDTGLRRIYKKVLTRANYDVIEAGSVQNARDLLKLFCFDIFICDIHMGRERGNDLIKEFRHILTKNGTLVVMCSAYGQYRMRIEELGADYFLEKPISLGTLLTLIDRLMDSNSAEQPDDPGIETTSETNPRKWKFYF